MSRVGKWAGKGMWAVRVRLPAERPAGQVAAVEALLEPMGAALTSFEIEGGKGWSVESLCERRPAAKPIQAALQAIGAPPASIDYIAPRNWVAETQRLLAPIRAGRFFVHGAHFDGLPPRGTVPLQIEASIAFGTGRHETTRGCLLALDRLARGGRRFKRPLDLGCGSGILALAMARLWDASVLAADNDAAAVAVARENMRINGGAERVRVVKSNGFAAAALNRGAPFDLIAANILARPLCRLARGFASHLAPRGIAVLSGLMTDQEPAVIAAQERQGLRLCRRDRLGDWSVLAFTPKRKRRLPGGSRRR